MQPTLTQTGKLTQLARKFCGRPPKPITDYLKRNLTLNHEKATSSQSLGEAMKKLHDATTSLGELKNNNRHNFPYASRVYQKFISHRYDKTLSVSELKDQINSAAAFIINTACSEQKSLMQSFLKEDGTIDWEKQRHHKEVDAAINNLLNAADALITAQNKYGYSNNGLVEANNAKNFLKNFNFKDVSLSELIEHIKNTTTFINNKIQEEIERQAEQANILALLKLLDHPTRAEKSEIPEIPKIPEPQNKQRLAEILEILNLSNATKNQIDHFFRRLSHHVHPDHRPDDQKPWFTQQFQNLHALWEALVAYKASTQQP